MTDTSTLIEQLAAHAKPVRPLASPLLRTAGWLLFAGALIAAVVAAYATFQVSVPGRSPRWTWLPLPFLLAWLGGLGLGCLGDAARLGPAAFALHGEVRECALAISLISLPLALGMLLMVRHAGVVRPAASAWLAMLASAALSSAGVGLFHEGETAWMALVWHLGAVALLSLACLACSRPLFAWIGYARAP